MLWPGSWSGTVVPKLGGYAPLVIAAAIHSSARTPTLGPRCLEPALAYTAGSWDDNECSVVWFKKALSFMSRLAFIDPYLLDPCHRNAMAQIPFLEVCYTAGITLYRD